MTTEQKEHIEHWVIALRSGQYKQGAGVLRRKSISEKEPDSYCCLGVASNISNLGDWILSDRFCTFGTRYAYLDFLADPAHDYLTQTVAEYYGIDKDAEHTLSQMNDEDRSFAEIADYLEQKYLG